MTGPVIEVVGLEVFAHHGVYEHERREGQRFLFDVRLTGSGASEQSDRLEDAIDYGRELIPLVRAEVAHREVRTRAGAAA